MYKASNHTCIKLAITNEIKLAITNEIMLAITNVYS